MRWLVGLGIVILALLVCPATARADWENCFLGAERLALCNGIVGGLGGGLGIAGASGGLAAADDDTSTTAWVGLAAAGGIYSSVSGGALIAMSQSMPAHDPLRDTALVVGIVDVGIGSAALIMATVLGINTAVKKRALRDDDEEEGDEDDDIDEVDIQIGVPSDVELGRAPGLTLRAAF